MQPKTVANTMPNHSRLSASAVCHPLGTRVKPVSQNTTYFSLKDRNMNSDIKISKETDKSFMIQTSLKGLISVITSALTGFPDAGGFLSLAFDYSAKRKQDRLIDFVNSLSNDLSKVKQQINPNYTNNNDFIDVLETTIKYTVNERSSEKRAYFKNILKNSVIDPNGDYDKTEKYLRIIDAMDELELLLLKIFWNPTKFNIENGNIIDRHERVGFGTKINSTEVLQRLLPNFNRADITIAWNDLESKWLIDVSDNKMVMNPLDSLMDRLLKKGKDLMNYIMD